MARDLTRRAASLMLLALAVAGCDQASSKPASVPDDMIMGNTGAKVTVVEYASVACPICGKWYREVFPAFKAKYIDTGRIKFVSREMLVGNSTEVTAAAAGFLLARCSGKDRYFKVTDAIYRTQDQLFNDPRGALLVIGKTLGMSDAQFSACVQDAASLKALNDRVEANAKRDNVTGTPTFVINGKSKDAGYRTLAELDAAIAQALKAPS